MTISHDALDGVRRDL